MDIDYIRLLIDFGFMVLIWAVQLVVYPSFQYYNDENLIKWHRLYTNRVTIIVLPLMLTQLILSIIQVVGEISIYSVLSLVIIAALWILTFVIFVPLHQGIDRGEATDRTTHNLVAYNWIRTVLWTLVFIFSLYQNIFF